MKKDIKKHIGVLVIIIIMISPLICYNFRYNTKFFDASLTTIISACSVVFVSFYLVQWKMDTREKIKHIESVINEIKFAISSDALYTIESVEQRQASLLLQRKVANKISVLENYDLKPEVNNQIKELKKCYRQLREFIGDHIDDYEYIQKSRNEFLKSAMRMDDMLDKICVMLHK